MPNGRKPLSERIEWQFTVSLQGHTSRYGVYEGGYWKQFLPAGIPVDGLHPPKLIPEVLYNMAAKSRTRQ